MEVIKLPQRRVSGLQLKRVAAYARVSTEKESMLHSLSNQISYYDNLISGMPNWVFAGIYADEGISGTKNDRPEFNRMMQDARDHKFDMIITKKVTRLGRNILTVLQTIRELKDLGIDVYFEKDNVHTLGSNGEMYLTALAIYAEEEARSASENVRWRIKRKFQSGIPTYVKPYGYKFVDGHLEIIPEEAEVIRRIYQMYLDGMGLQAIANKLNSDGNTPGKNQWWIYHIGQILRNEKYTGNLMLQKTYRPDVLTKKKVRNIGQWEKFYVRETHEAIIPQEMFDRVQEEIARREKKVGQKASTKPLLAGKLKCGQCGSCFLRKQARSGKNGQNTRYLWACNGYTHHGKGYCQSKRIPEEVLIQKTKEVLKLPNDAELTRESVEQNIDHIESVAANQLRFFLRSGKVEIAKWTVPSRSQSWTPEMREQARKKALQRLNGK